jgi:hypothetical protein
MSRHTLQPRKKRLLSPIAWLMIAILLVVALYNATPALTRLMQSGDPEVGASTQPVATTYATTDLRIPAATRGGECREPSEFVSRTDALRCVVGVSIYDPCFIIPGQVGEQSTIVCGVDGGSGVEGFAIAPKPPLQPTLTPSATIKQGDLGWLSYPLDIVGGKVTLVNDQYYFPNVESMGGSLLVALSKMRAHGDLDGDGDPDMAVLLVADADDDRMLIYLAAVINQNGNAIAAGSILLGDRVNVDKMRIENGQIVVNMRTHASDDPPCCPTLEVVWRYNLQGNRLVQEVDGWRLELPGDVACVPVQAAQQAGNAASEALPFLYQCSNGAWLRPGLFPGALWVAQYAGDSSAEPRYVPITRIWQ